jgi:hypothetical protein
VAFWQNLEAGPKAVTGRFFISRFGPRDQLKHFWPSDTEQKQQPQHNDNSRSQWRTVLCHLPLFPVTSGGYGFKSSRLVFIRKFDYQLCLWWAWIQQLGVSTFVMLSGVAIVLFVGAIDTLTIKRTTEGTLNLPLAISTTLIFLFATLVSFMLLGRLNVFQDTYVLPECWWFMGQCIHGSRRWCRNSLRELF